MKRVGWVTEITEISPERQAKKLIPAEPVAPKADPAPASA
jgi:hypothetical protein